MGCDPTKKIPSGIKSSAWLTKDPFTEPTSVITAPCFRCGNKLSINGMILETGVQRTTRSTSLTASAKFLAQWSMTPKDLALSKFSRLRPNPEISSTRLYLRQALAKDAPKRPTPMMVIFSNSFMLFSTPAQDKNPKLEITMSAYEEF